MLKPKHFLLLALALLSVGFTSLLFVSKQTKPEPKETPASFDEYMQLLEKRKELMEERNEILRQLILIEKGELRFATKTIDPTVYYHQTIPNQGRIYIF